jgi:hypothetical protein
MDEPLPAGKLGIPRSGRLRKGRATRPPRGISLRAGIRARRLRFAWAQASRPLPVDHEGQGGRAAHAAAVRNPLNVASGSSAQIAAIPPDGAANWSIDPLGPWSSVHVMLDWMAVAARDLFSNEDMRLHLPLSV